MNEIKTHDTMSPEAQRIAIAEACRWSEVKCELNYFLSRSTPKSTLRGNSPKGNWQDIPNYLNDLNAMHEAEQTLTGNQGGDYDSYLWLIIQRDKSRPASWHATAAQRCEAFLRTIGKWRAENDA